MRVNWFSPLRPAECEAARFTERLLPHLSRCAQVILWTGQSGWDHTLEQHAPVRRFHPQQMAWDEVNLADVSVYHFGRDPGKDGLIREVSRRHPGVVVLHEGAEEVETALGVVTTTRRDFDRLRKQDRSPVILLPQPAILTMPDDDSERPSPPYRIVALTSVEEPYRIEEVLRVLAGMPGREQVQLVVHGPLATGEALRALVAHLELGTIVTSEHSSTPPDLVLDLTGGNASSVHAPAWPQAVATAAAGSIGNDDVIPLRLDHFRADVAELLRSLVRDPQRVRAIGATRQRRLEEARGCEEYARDLLDWITEATGWHAPLLAEDLARQAAREMSIWSGDAVNADQLREVALAIHDLAIVSPVKLADARRAA